MHCSTHLKKKKKNLIPLPIKIIKLILFFSFFYSISSPCTHQSTHFPHSSNTHLPHSSLSLHQALIIVAVPAPAHTVHRHPNPAHAVASSHLSHSSSFPRRRRPSPAHAVASSHLSHSSSSCLRFVLGLSPIGDFVWSGLRIWVFFFFFFAVDWWWWWWWWWCCWWRMFVLCGGGGDILFDWSRNIIILL